MIELPTDHRIESSRLVLAPFQEHHLSERYVQWLNDPDVVQFSENRHRIHSLRSCEQYWRATVEAGNILWAIERKEENNLHIGNLAAYIDTNNAIAELAIIIGERRSWSQGLGLEAWQAAMDWLLDRAKVRKVHAGTMAANSPMLRIFEKSGMSTECVRPRHFLLNNTPMDIVFAGKFATENS